MYYNAILWLYFVVCVCVFSFSAMRVQGIALKSSGIEAGFFASLSDFISPVLQSLRFFIKILIVQWDFYITVEFYNYI